MARDVVVRVEVDGDLATLTLRSGGCGGRRTRTVALRRDQTPEERLADLQQRYPTATIVTSEQT